MITRAQAEALSTLAESLEACERLGITLTARYYTARLDTVDQSSYLEKGLTAESIRGAVKALLPKQET